jgi:hypothetical protein
MESSARVDSMGYHGHSSHSHYDRSEASMGRGLVSDRMTDSGRYVSDKKIEPSSRGGDNRDRMTDRGSDRIQESSRDRLNDPIRTDRFDSRSDRMDMGRGSDRMMDSSRSDRGTESNRSDRMEIGSRSDRGIDSSRSGSDRNSRRSDRDQSSSGQRRRRQ